MNAWYVLTPSVESIQRSGDANQLSAKAKNAMPASPSRGPIWLSGRFDDRTNPIATSENPAATFSDQIASGGEPNGDRTGTRAVPTTLAMPAAKITGRRHPTDVIVTLSGRGLRESGINDPDSVSYCRPGYAGRPAP